MNYGKMVEDAFSFSWRNKSLWIFGLFAGNGSNFNFQVDSEQFQDFNAFGMESFEEVWHIILPILWAAMVLGLVFFVLNMICSPALVDGFNKLARGGSYKFWESYSRGIDFFFRKVGLSLILVAVMIVLVVLAILPIILMHLIGLLLFIPIFIIGIFVAFNLYTTAERVMVVRDCSIGDSLEEAFFLFKTHFGKFVIITLIFIGLAMGIGLVLGLLALMLYFPVNILVKSMTDSLPMMLLLGVTLALPFTVVIGGFSGSFFHGLYTLFYFGLVDPATPYGQKTPQPVSPQPTA